MCLSNLKLFNKINNQLIWCDTFGKRSVFRTSHKSYFTDSFIIVWWKWKQESCSRTCNESSHIHCFFLEFHLASIRNDEVCTTAFVRVHRFVMQSNTTGTETRQIDDPVHLSLSDSELTTCQIKNFMSSLWPLSGITWRAAGGLKVLYQKVSMDSNQYFDFVCTGEALKEEIICVSIQICQKSFTHFLVMWTDACFRPLIWCD